MKILWSPLAVERLEEYFDYIARDNASAANRWLDTALKKVDALSSNPELGRVVPELQVPSIREIVYGNYRIINRLADDAIRVLTVRHFKQVLPFDEVR